MMKLFSPLKTFFLALLSVLALMTGMSVAYALPPGGASPNTPGTSSTVSPTTVRAGDTVSFTVSGFPAHEQVRVKVDDGAACPRDAAQGACVVHQQKSDGNGNVRGSFLLPRDLEEGEHTLRFLATEVIRNASGEQQGTKGYSNQSPVFTVVGVNENSAGGTVISLTPDQVNQRDHQNNSSGDHSTQNQNDQNTQQKNSGNNTSDSSNNGSSEHHSDEKNSSGEHSGHQHNNASSDSNENVEEEIVYTDADGNVISREEYDKLMAASENKDKKPASSSPSASSSASSSAKPSASSATPSATTDAVAQENSSKVTEESGNSVPWIGIGAFLAALIAAGVIVFKRRNEA
ncbi:plasmid partitioning protein [Rothia sp. P6271]|uniref:plasmid partitioning protein n=1 Tax=unclassified Rothia (in: high G+C Gram-positive bacteria) TaxID=2689056 RepID=UPI003ACB8902